MKIAFFLDTAKILGGAGNLLLQQAKLMSELYEVIVVIPSDKKGNYNHEYAERCRQYDIPYVCMQYSTAFNFIDIDYTGSMQSTVEIEIFAKKEGITFFHSVQLNPAVEYVSRKLKVPHLMSIYQLQKNEFKVCSADIYAKYHLCDSQLYSDLWKQQLGVCSRYIRPVALRDDIKWKATYSKEKIKILMLGTVCERKNQLTAIKAIEQCLALYRIELHIAGNIGFSYAEECITYVKEHKLESYIVFHDFVSNIAPLLEEYDCLLCSSVDESFPSSMVEALSYDMTVISTPVAGVPELFIDKYNSFISKDYTVAGIRESIVECLNYYASGKIVKIHENAARTWRENFERRIVRQQLDAYYKDIAEDNAFKNADVFWHIGEDIKWMEERLKGINAEDEEWIYTRGLYYTFLGKKLHGEDTYIWGAGKMGKITAGVLETLFPYLNIVAFIDTYKEGKYCGRPIIRPEEVPIEKNNCYCIGFAQSKDMAIHYLEERGLELNEQIFCMP